MKHRKKSTLVNCDLSSMAMDATHTVWECTANNLHDVRRSITKVRMMTGVYMLQSTRAKFSQYCVEKTWPLCRLLLTVPRRHFCFGSYLFVTIFIVLLVAWLCGHSKTVRIALCIVFCFVQARTVTTSLQQLLTLLSV